MRYSQQKYSTPIQCKEGQYCVTEIRCFYSGANCINHVFHVFGSPEDLPSLMTGRCDVMYVAAEP